MIVKSRNCVFGIRIEIDITASIEEVVSGLQKKDIRFVPWGNLEKLFTSRLFDVSAILAYDSRCALPARIMESQAIPRARSSSIHPELVTMNLSGCSLEFVLLNFPCIVRSTTDTHGICFFLHACIKARSPFDGNW